jgi:hypothetical protein
LPISWKLTIPAVIVLTTGVLSMPSDYLLDQAIEAINSGNKQSGRWLLTDLLNDDPYHEEAWLWLALVVDTREERIQCLEQVLAINPYNEDARRELAMLLPNEVTWYRKPQTFVETEAPPEEETARRLCPHCSEPVDVDDQFCRFCGEPLDEEEEDLSGNAGSPDPKQYSKRPWFFSVPVLVFTFFFLTPLWSVLVLADDQQSGMAKVLAVLVFLIYVSLLFFASVYYGALIGI